MLKAEHSLPMHLHAHRLYVLEQHSDSFEIRSAKTRINTEGNSLTMKLGPGTVYNWPTECKTLR